MNHLDLFSGIGGFAVAARRMQWNTVGFCEIDPWCQKLLRYHWPDVPIYKDVRNVTAKRLESDGIIPQLITGGFPCQDISTAGKGAGIDGSRSGLWSEIARLIGELRPQYAVMENVSALLARGLERVLGDLAALGYDAEWHCIPASIIGAPHRRDRIWIVAYPADNGPPDRRGTTELGKSEVTAARCTGSDVSHADEPRLERCLFGRITKEKISMAAARRGENVADTLRERQPGSRKPVKPLYSEAAAFEETANAFSGCFSDFWKIEPDVGRVADGVPRRMDRLKGLGNAIVPPVAQIIFEAIRADKEKKNEQ